VLLMGGVRSGWAALLGALAVVPLACGDPAGSASDAGVSTAGSAGPADGGVASPGDVVGAREGAAIALSPEGDLLYVADEDHEALRVVALPLGGEIATVAMAGRPAQLVVTASRVLVTVRANEAGSEGALVVLSRRGKELRETGRVAVPADAWGLAVSPDLGTAVVTSAWTARVSVVDLAALTVSASLEVAREPRGVLVTADGKRAFVSHLVGSAFSEVALAGAGSKVEQRELPASPVRAAKGTKLHASLGYAVVASPAGDRLFFPRHALGAMSWKGWFGSAAVDVWLPERNAPFAPDRRGGYQQAAVSAELAALPSEMFGPFFHQTEAVSSGDDAFVQPRAAVYRKKTNTLLVASEGTNVLAELDALMQDPTLGVVRQYRIGRSTSDYYQSATEGGAPSGIALSKDEDTAYVYCRSTDDVAAVRLVSVEGDMEVVPPLFARVIEPPAASKEAESLALGRALFYDAVDGVTSGGLGCAGCHPDGRDDGHVWHEVTTDIGGGDSVTRFFGSAATMIDQQRRWNLGLPDEQGMGAVGYARQTPMLAGRVAAAGPYGWHAENEDLASRIRAGMILHRWADAASGTTENRNARAYALAEFLRKGLVPPPRATRELSAEEVAGKALFESAATQCSTCHVPASGFTDRFNPPLPQPAPPAGFAKEADTRYKTPSLLYVAGTAPYFHDGRHATLEALVEKNAGMGKTAQLSAAEKQALVAYLRTL
jgi:DNA-binding beta-propeller fold protein YncE